MYFVFTTAEESGLLGAEYLRAASCHCRWIRSPPTSTSTASTIWARRATSCCSAPIDRRLGRWRRRSPRSAAATIGARSASGARLLLPLGSLSRSPRPVCRRCRSASRASSSGPNAEELKKKQEAYNTTDYHQPSDEFDPSVELRRRRRRLQVARAAGLAHCRAARDAAVQRRRSVRQRAEERHESTSMAAELDDARLAHHVGSESRHAR